jgi:hypothetical protein
MAFNLNWEGCFRSMQLGIIETFVGFEVLTEVVMKSSIIWDITPCNPLEVNGRFGGTCAELQICLLPASCWFLSWLLLRP